MVRNGAKFMKYCNEKYGFYLSDINQPESLLEIALGVFKKGEIGVLYLWNSTITEREAMMLRDKNIDLIPIALCKCKMGNETLKGLSQHFSQGILILYLC